MAQVTWRADEQLVRRVKKAATDQGRSVNEYVTLVLSAATDPTFAGSEADAVRARLELAGLVVEPRRTGVVRPSADEVAEAGRRAAVGTPVADLIAASR